MKTGFEPSIRILDAEVESYCSREGIDAWQTLKPRCTQPTDVQQLKAEIAAVVEQLINTDSSKPLSSICDAIKRLRQLSAV